jgi:two-component system, OmpR family, phosphate regulon sensor histidine kinase PhoR
LGSATSMISNDSQALSTLIVRQREGLLSRWRQQVRLLASAAHLDAPTLNDHIPGFVDEVSRALMSGTGEPIQQAITQASAVNHGFQRVEDGFDIAEVVAEYNLLRSCIHDMADAAGLRLQGQPFYVLNRVFDQAIGIAVQAFAAHQAAEVQRRRDEYLAFVAHDLRTPLSAIALAARALEQAGTQPSTAQTSRMLNVLRRNVVQLEHLVAKVLEENSVVQTDLGAKLQRRDIDLWSFVQTMISDVTALAAAANTEVCNDVPDDLVIFADADLLRRIWYNLIGNAMKYTPGGTVSIGAAERADLGAIECWVSDDGAGIAVDLLDQVFDKGARDPHAEETSNGLGLAIVKTFVQAHGGSVSAQNNSGAGAVIRFLLPIKTTALLADSQAADSQAPDSNALGSKAPDSGAPNSGAPNSGAQ